MANNNIIINIHVIPLSLYQSILYLYCIYIYNVFVDQATPSCVRKQDCK